MKRPSVWEFGKIQQCNGKFTFFNSFKPRMRLNDHQSERKAKESNQLAHLAAELNQIQILTIKSNQNLKDQMQHQLPQDKVASTNTKAKMSQKPITPQSERSQVVQQLGYSAYITARYGTMQIGMQEIQSGLKTRAYHKEKEDDVQTSGTGVPIVKLSKLIG
ncbi:hypothetical protein Tco_1428349 [Tanacetum coccineum]